MGRIGVLLITALLFAAGTAKAVTIQTTDASHPWQHWADTAQVPTWAGTLPLTTAAGYFDCGGRQAAGCTNSNQYDPIAVKVALGQPVDYEHGYLLHELGQVFWTVYMTPADEDQFMRTVGIPGGSADWTRLYTTVTNGVTIQYPPFEWFAEGYRLCALFGVNQPASANTFTAFGYPGLQASFAARQRQVCQLIDRVGADNGIATPAQTSHPAARIVKHHAQRIRLTWGWRRGWGL